MSLALSAIAIVAWYASGVAGFTYWWTKDHDLGFSEAPLALFAGLIGPAAWGLGYLIHGDWDKTEPPRVLIHRRNK